MIPEGEASQIWDRRSGQHLANIGDINRRIKDNFTRLRTQFKKLYPDERMEIVSQIEADWRMYSASIAAMKTETRQGDFHRDVAQAEARVSQKYYDMMKKAESEGTAEGQQRKRNLGWERYFELIPARIEIAERMEFRLGTLVQPVNAGRDLYDDTKSQVVAESFEDGLGVIYVKAGQKPPKGPLERRKADG